MRVDATSYEDASERVVAWARAAESRMVCVANVHMVMVARDEPGFRTLVNGADLVTPDGMPLVWALRLLRVERATRVYGPDLVRAVCRRAAKEGLPVGFHGGGRDTLERLVRRLRAEHPSLDVVYAHAPPFREPTLDELAAEAEAIATSGARVLFVGLGCPKQERWMAMQRGRVPAVMLGVGAAFDFLSGAKPQAPAWMQRSGLEWAFRLATEPGRLWRRYAANNPRFVALFGAQVLRERLLRGNEQEVTVS
jgi:N-acetylglucosaminyldiphosphoundecaprenol N-acetyl-beta-D-mannosaminyltransferase